MIFLRVKRAFAVEVYVVGVHAYLTLAQRAHGPPKQPVEKWPSRNSNLASSHLVESRDICNPAASHPQQPQTNRQTCSWASWHEIASEEADDLVGSRSRRALVDSRQACYRAPPSRPNESTLSQPRLMLSQTWPRFETVPQMEW